MKVYVPKNNDEVLLSGVGYGECFWLDKELYLKTDTCFCNIIRSFSKIYAVRLRDGVLFDFSNCPKVTVERDIAILESKG